MGILDSSARVVRGLAGGFMELLFPVHYCSVCGEALEEEELGICGECLGKLPITFFESWKYNPMEERMDGRVKLVSAFSCYYFRQGERLRRLIHDFKYHGDQLIARDLGRAMGRRAMAAGFTAPYDALIPVPLHPKRLRKRGYNQSLLLAKGFSDVTGIPIMTDVLVRSTYTPTQTKLGAKRRYANVRNKFSLGKRADEAVGKTLLVIDDVFTTGATSESCCLALREIRDVRLGLACLAYVMG